ncbi:ABC transporter substrate-binding protein [Streptomyces sp. NRRL WC-3742]|uniref:ABC transporter substrate-binding protein n=1 Tax=Streptomyces sp. NRRL WC-3742 TaxID=1463934 RepID=UPI00099E0A83|nr:ABC transporter substrate-binding protein [Streptomyces sp. NRRL WC-3742]
MRPHPDTSTADTFTADTLATDPGRRRTPVRSTGFRSRLGLVAALTVLPLTAACAGSATTPGSGDAAAGGKPVDGGTLTLAVPYGPTCLDPHQGQADALFSRAALDSLVWQDDGGAIQPWLAKSWKISADQKTYTFTLRSGVTFSDGTPFDAAAVRANLDHVVAPATKSAGAAQLIENYRSARVVDPQTVEVTLAAPASSFLTGLASPSLGIESPATLAGDPKALCSKVVGTGPFTSTEGFTPQQGITYQRRADYAWAPEGSANRGAAHLDKLAVRIVPDNSSRQGALTSGQADAAAAVAPVNVAKLKADAKFTVQSAVSPGVPWSFNPNTEKGPLTDVRLRKALRNGIDWHLIVQKLYFGVYPAATGPLSPSTPQYAAGVADQYRYDAAAAGKLLDDAGWTTRDAEGYRTKGGKRLSLDFLYIGEYFSQYTALATQVQAAAKDLGVEIRNQNLDTGTYVKRVLAGDYDLLNSSANNASPDALRLVFGSAHIPTAKIDNNAARYRDDQVDSQLAEALATTEVQRQKTLYASVQQKVTDDAAILPVFSNAYVLGTSVKVHGVVFEQQSFPNFADAWLAP